MASSSTDLDGTTARGTPPKQQYTSLSSLMKSSPGREGLKNADRDRGYGAAKATDVDRSRSREGRGVEAMPGTKDKKKGKLSLWKMMALTVSMGGSQVSLPGWGSRHTTDALDRLDSVSQA